MFDEKEWLELVNELISVTKSNALKWVEQGNCVIAVVADSSYEIGSVDGDDRIPYYLSVSVKDNGALTEIARIESEPVSEERDWTAAEKLIELQKLAFRSAKGAPQIFSKLLSDLKAATDPPV